MLTPRVTALMLLWTAGFAGTAGSAWSGVQASAPAGAQSSGTLRPAPTPTDTSPGLLSEDGDPASDRAAAAMVDALKRYMPKEPAEADGTVLSAAERDLLSASTTRALATVRNASGETFSGAAHQRLVLVYMSWVLTATKRPLTAAALASYEARFRRFDHVFVEMWQTEMARLGVGPAQVTLMILAVGFQNDLWTGAVWRGGPRQIVDRVRSLPAEAVAGFAEAAGLSSGRRFVAANSLLGVDALFSGSRFQMLLFDSALQTARRLLASGELQGPSVGTFVDTAVAAAPEPAAPSAPSTPPPGAAPSTLPQPVVDTAVAVTAAPTGPSSPSTSPTGTEGATVGQAIEAAVRSESAGDWPTALRHYENLRQLDPSIQVFVDAAIARVKTKLEESGADAFRRARLYDAIGRRLDAIIWYERAVGSLPDSNENKKSAADRLLELRGDR